MSDEIASTMSEFEKRKSTGDRREKEQKAKQTV
jgi:hypothetical protein